MTTFPETLDLGTLIISGHCAHPQTKDPEESHMRCARNGSGCASRPTGKWHPCPCACHLGETFECGNCGLDIREAPTLGLDSDGDPIYMHVDRETGRAIGQECP